ncbi:alpha/beta fold hydrolase [Actinosynnema mirum]|uniref:Alpha/beta hydrolase fold protein n=1 Tax=Actinosynnema mirum (strain ATCC 29888 / DSM 43827 / JCM 3225 / NBRC 14064 / NCIMB 13271 / NRRL B-12336 / IMRU 3971 / 101) TaxID=446462 RepID=C6WI63_ACTMD|nr:alpha/beta fold hydrolase [Actinosynnema mirum]ACU34514.1 alpha/beta hydrolase fold protein [Actinosynnema mirum DSM 43827]AXX27885.1 Lysophospholipase [Actinosynnema pretiosum subsp. pretiosum]
MIESNVPGRAGELVVRTWPNLEATWLAVLVHGCGEHAGRYGHVAEALVAAGALVVAADQAGHGASEGERALVEDLGTLVGDVDTVIGAAGVDLPVVLVGHGVGGLVAARYAQDHQDRLAALVLSAPVLGAWEGLDALGGDDLSGTEVDPAELSRDEEVGRAYAADPLVWHGPVPRPTLEAVERAIDEVNFGPVLDRVPVLWLHGGADRLVPEADTRTGADRLRGARFEERVYPGARHEVLRETNRDEVLGDVVDFARRALGGS